MSGGYSYLANGGSVYGPSPEKTAPPSSAARQPPANPRVHFSTDDTRFGAARPRYDGAPNPLPDARYASSGGYPSPAWTGWGASGMRDDFGGGVRRSEGPAYRRDAATSDFSAHAGYGWDGAPRRASTGARAVVGAGVGEGRGSGVAYRPGDGGHGGAERYAEGIDKRQPAGSGGWRSNRPGDDFRSAWDGGSGVGGGRRSFERAPGEGRGGGPSVSKDEAVDDMARPTPHSKGAAKPAPHAKGHPFLPAGLALPNADGLNLVPMSDMAQEIVGALQRANKGKGKKKGKPDEGENVFILGKLLASIGLTPESHGGKYQQYFEKLRVIEKGLGNGEGEELVRKFLNSPAGKDLKRQLIAYGAREARARGGKRK